MGRIIVCLAVLLLAGCSQIIYNPDTREIKVNRVFDDNELNGLEIVFPDGSYIVVDKATSRADQEGLAILQLLIQAGLIRAPVTP